MMRILMTGKCRTCVRLLLCLLLCVSLLPVTAFAEAEDTLDLTKRVNLTLQYEIEGTQFRLYKVAEVSQNLEFTLTGDFAGYPVEVNGLDSAGWRALAETLASFVERDGIEPLKTGVIDEQGTLAWSGLEVGMYLVLGEERTLEQYKYSPMPSLIMLPSQNAEGKWEYDTVIRMKSNEEEIPVSDTEMIAVMKVWQDHGFEEKRPEAITAELYMDGVLYDTVSLDKANNWSYEWKSLPAGHKWTAMEKDIPDFYTVTSVREDRYLVITNCFQPEEPSVPVTPDKPGGGSHLPQTGQLWWPVPILALTGIVFFTVGWVRRKTQENGNE